MSFFKALFTKTKPSEAVAPAVAKAEPKQASAEVKQANQKAAVKDAATGPNKRNRNRKQSRLRQFFDSVKNGNQSVPSVKLSNRIKALERSLAFLDEHVQKKSAPKAPKVAAAPTAQPATPAVANAEANASIPVAPPVVDPSPVTTAAQPKVAWKKGTGYGSDYVSSYQDVYTAAKATKDDAAVAKSLFHLKNNLSKILNTIKQDEVDLIVVLTRSQLLPFISELFSTDSVLEMERRSNVWHAALDLCWLLADHASTRVLLIAPVTDCNTQSSVIAISAPSSVSSETKISDEKKCDDEKTTGKNLISIRSRLDRLAAKVRFSVEKARKAKGPVMPTPPAAATAPVPAAPAAPAAAAAAGQSKKAAKKAAKPALPAPSAAASSAPAAAAPAAAPVAVVQEEEKSVAARVVEVADRLTAKLKESVGLNLALAQKVQEQLQSAVGPADVSVCESTLKLSADQNSNATSSTLTINIDASSLDLTADKSTVVGSTPTTSRSEAAPASSTPTSDCAAVASTPTSVASSDEEKKVGPPDYVTNMRELQFAEVEEMVGHHFLSSAAKTSGGGRNNAAKGPAQSSAQWIRRVVGEYSDLRESLPLNPESSVFMRVHDEDVAYSRMLITGPADTPYANGCFLFDVYLPADYPRVPPKVNLMTTGKGAVRFNPNLYNCGKVCLSLLGTWGGSAGEGWDAKTSTLLQLAVSIQSLIFVPEPYFNEPGYESQHNGVGVHPQSESYNRNIEEQTLRWAVLDILKSPPAGFEKVVRNHFFMRQHAVLKDVERWIDRREADANNKGNVAALRTLQTELIAAFKDLKLEA